MNAGQYVTPNVKLVRLIGKGAMGEVWLAEHVVLQSTVAVKFMNSSTANEERAILRFREEARAAARIDSPHVTRVYDAGTTETGQPYIVMEYLQGETLRERMKRMGPLPFDDIEFILGQTARGLAAAHKLGIWHRDIKPENLFIVDLGDDEFVKIMDFGIAKQSTAHLDISATGMAIGTPSYMSPQQLGDAKRVDHRADLWSLGVVVYEALTARKPFHGLDLLTLSVSVAKGVFKPPSQHRTEIPKSVDAWMLRALAREVDQRFNSALEMADEFLLAIPQQSPRPRKSSKPASSARLALAPTIVAPRPVPSQDKPHRIAKEAAPESAPKDSVRPSDVPAKPTAFPPRENPAIVITEHTARGLASITGLPTWLRAIGFSENNDALFASFGGGEVVCLELATRKARWWQRLFSRTYKLEAGSGILAVACGDGTVRILDVANGNVSKTLNCHETTARCVVVRRGTLLTAGDDTRLAQWNLSSGERLVGAVNPGQRIMSMAVHPNSGMVVTGAKFGNLRIWDQNLRLVKSEDLQCGTIRHVQFSPDGWGLAGACGDGRVRLWDTRNWTLSRQFEDESKKPVVSLTFDASSQVLVAGSSDGTLRLWSVATGQLQRVIPGTGESVHALAMSPDGRYLAIAFVDGTLHVYKWPLVTR